ncbi:MAG: glycine--tRNA ligase subunit beta, partial [Elusimicrobiota bacterium]|nr:glycine--tRNA ligase subunit beta [Elusimicrobiota bacterium]
MKNALLEIFCEHLPARFLIPALNQMKDLAARFLNERNLKFDSLRVYGTFRRLVLEIDGLAAKAEDIEKEIKGPPAKLLKDFAGNYTPQASGFAEKNGLKPQQLTIIETEKGPFIYAEIKIKGLPAEKILPEIFTEIIKNLTFPKSMRWEISGFKFARPVRGLIGLYGNKILRFEIAGVKSGRNTYPISSFGKKPIKIISPESYIETLRNQPQPILSDIEERKRTLINAVNSASSKLGYKADLDEDLVTESVSFTEHPVVLAGDMDIKFLTLPKELVTTALKKQLKMFPVLDEKGILQPHFIALRDGVSVNSEEVRTGFKNVMTARLTDAIFFFGNDIKAGINAMKEKLALVNFIDGMGNMLQKTERVESLAAFFAEKLNLTRQTRQDIQKAASFCYADLTSSVVYEFPELQGYMGCVYAQKAGFKEEVCKAMGEFYMPLTASSRLPQTLEGAILSLAGKIDTLAANFAAGQIPTGSEDPFALRRQAMGAVRIILDKKLNITLREIIDAASAELPPVESSQIGRLYDFIWQRFANILEGEAFEQDEIAAIENLNNKTLCETYTIIKALRIARKDGMLA